MEDRRTSKVVSASEAVKHIKSGSKLAIGGSLIRRHPMALIHEIIRQQIKDLTIYAWSSGIDIDLLVGAGCIKEAHSSYVGMMNIGLAKNFRRAVQQQQIRFVDASETCCIDRFRAATVDLSFSITKVPLGNDMRLNPEFQTEITCPFTGQKYVALKAFDPDVAILHFHRADKFGNCQMDPGRMMDNETDILIAKSAKKVIVSVEEIVDESEIISTNTRTFLPKVFVDYVVEAPLGAHPCSCDCRYDFDLQHATLYQEYAQTQESFDRYIQEYILDTKDFAGYLDKVGKECIDKIMR